MGCHDDLDTVSMLLIHGQHDCSLGSLMTLCKSFIFNKRPACKVCIDFESFWSSEASSWNVPAAHMLLVRIVTFAWLPPRS